METCKNDCDCITKLKELIEKTNLLNSPLLKMWREKSGPWNNYIPNDPIIGIDEYTKLIGKWTKVNRNAFWLGCLGIILMSIIFFFIPLIPNPLKISYVTTANSLLFWIGIIVFLLGAGFFFYANILLAQREKIRTQTQLKQDQISNFLNWLDAVATLLGRSVSDVVNIREFSELVSAGDNITTNRVVEMALAQETANDKRLKLSWSGLKELADRIVYTEETNLKQYIQLKRFKLVNLNRGYGSYWQSAQNQIKASR